MQPTQQAVVPIRFGAGTLTSGTATIDLNPAYDHIVQTIIISMGLASGALVQLFDPDGNIVWALGGISVAAGENGVRQATIDQLVPTASYLTLTTTVWPLAYCISGVRIAPPVSSL